MYSICDEVIKKAIPFADPQNSVDFETGKRWYSWVEFVGKELQKPKIYISHWWGGAFRDFIRMVRDLKKDELLSIHDSIWVCTFALNQFGEDFGESLVQSPFSLSLKASERVVLMIDRQAGSLNRTWCGFELWLTAEDNKELELYTPAGRVGSEKAGSGPLMDALERWDIRDTDASQPADRRQIVNAVAGIPELEGLVQVRPGKALLKDGLKELEDTTLATMKRRFSRNSFEFAHEARVFQENQYSFARVNNIVISKALRSLGAASTKGGCRIEDRSRRGITLGHLRALAREVKHSCQRGKLQMPGAEAPLQWNTITTMEVLECFIKPRTRDKRCSYVELVAPCGRPPYVQIAYCWTGPFWELMQAIEWQAEARSFSDTTAYALNIACNNFHDGEVECDSYHAKHRLSKHTSMICGQECKRLLVVKGHDRGWVMWYLLQATSEDKSVDLGSISGCLSCDDAFSDGSLEWGSFDSDIAMQLCNLDCANWQCNDQQDISTILRDISLAFPGLSDQEAQLRFQLRVRRIAAGPVLRQAAYKNDVDTIRWIAQVPGLQLGSKSLKGGLGQTALHMAACRGELAALSELLQLKADVHAEDLVCDTPLHYAALSGCAPAVRVLLRANGDPAYENRTGRTPLQVALENPASFLGVDTAECVQLLEAAEALGRLLPSDDSKQHHPQCTCKSCRTRSAENPCLLLSTPQTLLEKSDAEGHTHEETRVLLTHAEELKDIVPGIRQFSNHKGRCCNQM